MLVVNKKRAFSLVILILITVGLFGVIDNYMSSKPEVVETSTPSDITPEIDIAEQIVKADISNEFFSEYRMERERLRGKQLELLKEIVNNEAHEEKARAAASMRMVEITADMEKELKAENIVKSKGYKDCVIILQPQATTIIVQSENLTIDKEKELKDIVSKATGSSIDKMSIIVREP
ncbi:MAG: SpoIIIAH-like family protein [Syntrophomonadaceae bacterium]|nr:SpoIIIAH-like family protein [Syntrophomonadaceae bacterium]